MLIPLGARTSECVTLAQAKQALNVEHDEADDLIAIYVASATSYVGQGAELVLAPTAYEQRLDCWPVRCFEIEIGPVRDIDGIVYLDVNGDEQAVDPDLYGWQPTPSGAEVWFKSGFTRPALEQRPGAVRILFAAGFNEPDGTDGEDRLKLPAQAKVVVLMLVAHWWKTREPMVIGQVGNVPHSVDDLIDQLRVWRS